MNTFIEEIKRLGIQVRTNVKVKTIRLEKGQFSAVELDNGERIEGDAVIYSTWWKILSKSKVQLEMDTGTRNVGHTPLFATEVPLTSSETH